MIVIKRSKQKTAIATSLRWQVMDPFGRSVFGHKQLIEYVRLGGYVGIKFKNGQDHNLGVSKETQFEKYKELKIVSIARQVGMFPEVRERSILVLLNNTESSDGSIFAIGLINGNIVMDELVEKDEVDQVIDDYQKINIFASTGLDIAGDVVLFDHVLKFKFDLAAVLDNKKSAFEYIDVLKNELVILYLIIFIILALICDFAYSQWAKYEQENQLLMTSSLQLLNSPENRYSNAIDQFLTQPVLLAKDNISLIVKEINSFPYVFKRWQVSSIDCDHSTCLVHWASIGGSFDEFKSAAFPNWTSIAIDGQSNNLLGDLKSIKSNFMMATRQSTWPPQDQFPHMDEFSFEFADIFAKLGKADWISKFEAMHQVGLEPASKSNALIKHPKALFALPWHVDEQSWWSAQTSLEQYGEFCSLDQFKITFQNNSPLFSATGNCYVRH